MKYDNKIIGERIKSLRIENGHSQKELCAIVNRGRDIISKWENGREIPSLSILLKICDVYNCELGYILGEYSCKTQEKTDIQNKTGLCESAIDSLMDSKDKCDAKKEYEKKVVRSVANILLSSDAGIDFIKHISNYLISDSDMVSTLDMIDAMQNDATRFEKLVELVNTHNLLKTQKGLERLKNEYDSNPLQWYKIDLI